MVKEVLKQYLNAIVEAIFLVKKLIIFQILDPMRHLGEKILSTSGQLVYIVDTVSIIGITKLRKGSIGAKCVQFLAIYIFQWYKPITDRFWTIGK